MNCSILRAGLIFGALGIGLTGCQSAAKPTAKHATKKSDPDDPTAWSSTAFSKGDQDDSATSAASAPKSILKSSRLPGSLSSEGAEIERSLGVQ